MDEINLKKLAGQLNLSVSTVSKAFHNSYDVNAATRDRILKLAKELNYQPNPLARSLRTQKTKTIAVIIPEIANNFFTLAINGIESVAREQGYHVLIYLTHEDYSKEVAFTQLLHKGRVDGVLMSLSQGSKEFLHVALLQEKGIPVVFFDRVYDDGNTTKVSTNDLESGFKATEHLIRQGCKRIAHLFFSGDLSISQKRKAGYIRSLNNHQLPVDEKMIIRCSVDNENNYQLIKNLLLSKDKPDGIFSSVEKLAILTYQACEELKIRIPKELKIISFSNLETASLLNPSLSTITQPAFEMGKTAAAVLFKALEKSCVQIPDERIVLDSILIERRSTDIA